MKLSELINERTLSYPAIENGDWEATRKKWADTIIGLQYGPLPEKPDSLRFIQYGYDIPILNGKAVFRKILVCGTHPNMPGGFSFPIQVICPAQKKNVPYFVHLSFTPDAFFNDVVSLRSGTQVHDITPVEEIIDRGFGLIDLWYEDVTADTDDFSDGAAPVAGPRTKDSAGKLAIWAWAMQRCVDYAESTEDFAKNKAIAVGHSRLGKTALIAGVTDTRFGGVISNESGCGGAAPYLHKEGESLSWITGKFPFWFRERFLEYQDREEALPYDQQFMIACIAPRLCVISSAEKDNWSDQKGEMASCLLASGIYEALGLPGFIGEDKLPEPGDAFTEGLLCYYMRSGVHDLLAEDWLHFLDACEKLK